MTTSIRKFALTAHVTLSVGLLGSIAAFLSLAIAGLTSDDAQTVRAVYPAMDWVARYVIVPLATTALLTGLVESLSTAWGLFRHYWVVAKLALTAFAAIVLLAKVELIAHAARLATEAVLPRTELRAAGSELALHAAAGLLVLLVPVILSVYKPRGLTRYGERMRRRLQQRARRPGPDLKRIGGGTRIEDGSITITLRHAHIVGFALIVLAAHVAVLHIAGISLHSH